MPQADLLIFDLDGTLIDSRLDLAQAVNAALENVGMPRILNETVYSYVGNGAPVLMRRALGEAAAEAQVEQALRFFLEYYWEHKLDFTTLYPGVRESLDRLRADGVALAVLTNKPVRISRAILDGLGLGAHFLQVYGGNSFESRKKPDPVGIEMLLAETGAAPSRTIMVGDSAVDVLTARNAGVGSCGVTYGFQPETLVEEPPDILVDRMEQLADRVLSDGVSLL
jgi:phosphoglycolate phosphatase